MSEIENVEEVVLAVAAQDEAVAWFEDLFGLGSIHRAGILH